MTSHDLAAPAEDLELLALTAARAGEIAMDYFRRDPDVWMKAGNSPVSAADIAVDEYLREVLLKARPDYGWLSEETVDPEKRLEGRRTFVVDPIDGTRAFIEGRSTWCVSVAVVEDGRPLAGVLDCPAREERFTAIANGGARRNDAIIRTGAPASPARVAGPKNLLALTAGRPGGQERVPYIPSLAYRLAMVAGGAIDATFVKPRSHDWDLAAADLILTEAGGAVRDRFGRQPGYAGPDPRHGTLVAGSGPLLEELSQAIAGLDH